MMPASARSRSRSLPRRLILLAQRILRSDHILITVVAVSMSLSAVAVYEATRAADEASDLLDQARIVSTEASRQVGYLQTLVDHDLDVLRTYCTAQVERDVARVTYLSDEPDLPALVTAGLTLDALRPLLLGDQAAECAADDQPGYLTQRAAERLESRQSEFASSGSTGADLEVQAAVFHRAETFLMSAGFLFAFVVAAIIAIDQLGSRASRPGRLRTRAVHRWQYALLIAAGVALLLGVMLLAAFTVQPLLVAGVLVGIVAILVAQWAWLRRPRAGPAAAQPAPVPPRRGARPQWWAEMIGAVALIAFTASAVGLSLVSIQEREAVARANAESAIALDLQRVGQQQALRALASLSFIAQLDAEEVTARQLRERAWSLGLPTPADDPDAVAALRAVVDERMRTADRDLRAQAAGTLADGPSADCVAGTPGEAPLPSDLLEELGSDPDSVLWYVLDQQVPSRACDVMSALSRQEARIWSTHGSTFTVALVVLGLAGFLLALASSSERSARSSRTLLVIGALGTGFGILLALLPLPALIAGTDVPRGEAAQRFGERLAESETDTCASGGELDEALATFAGYGPAFVARAFATDCEATLHEWPTFSSERRADAVPAIIADLDQALAAGPVTPALTGTLGWFLILDGIQSADDGLMRRGLVQTEQALETLVTDAGASGSSIHLTRFNRALALAALGEHETALRAYQDAERCLEAGAAGCPGGGISDAGVQDDIRLGALADLELIGDAAGMDDYRAAVLGLRSPRGSGLSLPDARFDVYPQELQVALLDGIPPEEVKVIWYHRPDDGVAWGVLYEASRRTMRGTGHLGQPIAAGWLLESGQYRADVYVGGRRVELQSSYESDGALARYESQRLGVSLVVPDDWFEWRDDGVEWHLGPDEYSGVTVRRVEGMVPGSDVRAFLDGELGAWWATAGDAALSPVADGWLFGLPDVVVKESADLDADGLVDVVDAAGLAPYASDAGCGGALFTVRAAATPGSPPAWRLYDSIVLERALDGLPPQSDVLEADGISVQVPEWWDAAIRPAGSTGDLFSAKDCRGGANLLLSTDEYEGDLATYVGESVGYYEGAPEEYPEFVLESRDPLSVAGADAGELLVYTWRPAGFSEPIRQWQMYGMRGTRVVFATITTWAADREYWKLDLDVILPSLAMTDP